MPTEMAMTYLAEVGILALGRRLRAVSEQLYGWGSPFSASLYDPPKSCRARGSPRSLLDPQPCTDSGRARGNHRRPRWLSGQPPDRECGRFHR